MRRMLLWLCCLGLLPLLARAEDVDYAKLVQQLDSDNFAERQDASDQLRQAGAGAIPAVEQAAVSDSLEVSNRGFALLKEHLQSDDEPTRAAAKQALQNIAKSAHPRAAARASQILEPPQQPQIMPALPGVIQIQVQAAANRRVTVKNVNGVKDVEAEEDGVKVKIHDDPNNGITLEISEKIDGMEEVKKYEAKNAEELKKNHPEAYKTYEKYSRQPVALPPAVPAVRLQPIRVLRAKEVEELNKSLESARQELEQTRRELENVGENEAVKKALERLEQAQKRLDELKGAFENR